MNKRPTGGWAVTLKAAGLQGLPVTTADPLYWGKWKYASALMMRMGMATQYDDAIRARERQTRGS